MKLWLALATVAKKEQSEQVFAIDNALVVIDEMWHNFILFTKDYCEFCENIFGKYLHHSPSTAAESKKQKALFENMSRAEIQTLRMDQLRWQYEFTMINLGKEVFLRWYQYYPKNFTVETLAKLAYETATPEKKVLKDKAA